MNLSFRALRADEIEVRIQSVKQNGAILVLYKDARCDMNLLDEVVGPLNWQREHSRDNANCTVSIWDQDRQLWVSKEDVGTDSYTEAEKGRASDSFKRACTNWGIGRELYTAPFIWISGAQKNDRFWVSELSVENHQIKRLTINACGRYGEKTDTVAFDWSRSGGKKKTPKYVSASEPDTPPAPTDAPEPATEEERAIASYPARDEMLDVVKRHYTGEKKKQLFEHYGIESFDELLSTQLMVAFNNAVKHRGKA